NLSCSYTAHLLILSEGYRTWANDEVVSVDALTIGASGVDAFIGLNGGTEEAFGLEATDVDFGLALLTEKLDGGQAGRSWTSLQATVGSVGFVGVDGLTIEATNLSVVINSAATDGTVADYSAQALEVPTGPETSLEFDMDGAEGDLLEVRGELDIDLFGFFQVSGGFALKKSTKTVTLANDEVVSVDALTIGASGVDAFIGLNGGTD